MERHISYRFCTSLWCSVNRYSERSGSGQMTSHYLLLWGGGGGEGGWRILEDHLTFSMTEGWEFVSEDPKPTIIESI